MEKINEQMDMVKTIVTKFIKDNNLMIKIPYIGNSYSINAYSINPLNSARELTNLLFNSDLPTTNDFINVNKTICFKTAVEKRVFSIYVNLSRVCTFTTIRNTLVTQTSLHHIQRFLLKFMEDDIPDIKKLHIPNFKSKDTVLERNHENDVQSYVTSNTRGIKFALTDKLEQPDNTNKYIMKSIKGGGSFMASSGNIDLPYYDNIKYKIYFNGDEHNRETIDTVEFNISYYRNTIYPETLAFLLGFQFVAHFHLFPIFDAAYFTNTLKNPVEEKYGNYIEYTVKQKRYFRESSKDNKRFYRPFYPYYSGQNNNKKEEPSQFIIVK